MTHLSGSPRRSSAYSPPELVRLGRAGPAGDVYAFGVVMWELALGLPLQAALAAPEGAAVQDWLAAQGAADPAEAEALPPGLLSWPRHVPKGYRALVSECLREAPRKRPKARDVVGALEQLLLKAAAEVLRA
ncbi:hypothetical protein GPECTOR_27g647 [Gonium pectorale]|uniref:Protein kinase domain-containing protein n=1 Tax=Gonium pectorale TaxID=33097 RepID=A0A150GF48_GONPE|nr:hypothetical protein GPECTOR_27g647 [Gonium pectorale]|eukprot:KXZ48477.1 hypothetical protein GPECTOR_27g647 [Gonium pectorale]